MPDHEMTTDELIRTILTTHRTWAVVGASPDPSRPAHFVPKYLQQRGYRIVPVNPEYAGEELFGERCYPTLLDVPDDVAIDVVDLFRRSHLVGPHVDEAIAVRAKAVWMQVGIVNEEAAARARDAGIAVVMDRCPKVEIPTLLGYSFRLGDAAA
jgi:predicted CoA-binding protein